MKSEIKDQLTRAAAHGSQAFVLVGERWRWDSNPRRLAPHTLSRCGSRCSAGVSGVLARGFAPGLERYRRARHGTTETKSETRQDQPPRPVRDLETALAPPGAVQSDPRRRAFTLRLEICLPQDAALMFDRAHHREYLHRGTRRLVASAHRRRHTPGGRRL
jgi:hypothetical protein